MSVEVLLKCNTSCASSSPVAGFAMAALRRGIHNLSMSSGTTPFSWSSSALAFRTRNEKGHYNKNNNKSWCYSPRLRIIGILLVGRPAVGVRMFASNRNCHVTTKEIRKYSSSKDCHVTTKVIRKYSSSKGNRFDFTEGGSTLISSQGPGVGGRGRKGGGEGIPIESFLVITEDPSKLSLESSFGQGSGEWEQESEDASVDSFSRGTYQSPESAAYCTDQPTATIREVEVGLMAELEDALGCPLSHAPQCPAPKPLVIVINGPSGVGKDAVIKKLQHNRRDIHFVVTATTMPMRPGEVDGVDYYFMSKTEFQEMIENHELLEHTIVYRDYKGIPKQQVREFMSQGMDVVLRVDVQGAATVRSILGYEAIFIFLVDESEMALVKRLIERKTETMDKMLVRVATAREEWTRMEEFDYVVVNQEGCLDRTVSLICSIIDVEEARVKPKSAEI